MKQLPKYIILVLEGTEKGKIYTNDYIIAKTKQLKEFGYSNLTEQEVENELIKILNEQETTVIGKFIKNEVKFIN